MAENESDQPYTLEQDGSITFRGEVDEQTRAQAFREQAERATQVADQLRPERREPAELTTTPQDEDSDTDEDLDESAPQTRETAAQQVSSARERGTEVPQS